MADIKESKNNENLEQYFEFVEQNLRVGYGKVKENPSRVIEDCLKILKSKELTPEQKERFEKLEKEYYGSDFVNFDVKEQIKNKYEKEAENMIKYYKSKIASELISERDIFSLKWFLYCYESELDEETKEKIKKLIAKIEKMIEVDKTLLNFFDKIREDKITIKDVEEMKQMIKAIGKIITPNQSNEADALIKEAERKLQNAPSESGNQGPILD